MAYGVTTVLLLGTVAAFFLWSRAGRSSFGWLQWALRIVVALPLLLSGVGHFARTTLFASIIPPVFPHRELLVVLSGAMEITGAIGLLLSAFTRSAAICLALLMVAIFPANVYAANQTIGGLRMPSVAVRTAMQIVYILLLLVAGYGVRRKDSLVHTVD